MNLSKQIKNAIGPIILSATLAACSKNDSATINASTPKDAMDKTLQNELKAVVKNFAAHGIPLQLSSYSFENKAINIKELKENLLNPGNFVPSYDGGNKESFKLHTLAEGSEVPNGLQNANPAARNIIATSVKKLSIHLDSYLPSAQRTALLNWKYNGKTFTTVCAYNKNGFVYDNILSNINFIVDYKNALTNTSNARTVTPRPGEKMAHELMWLSGIKSASGQSIAELAYSCYAFYDRIGHFTRTDFKLYTYSYYDVYPVGDMVKYVTKAYSYVHKNANYSDLAYCYIAVEYFNAAPPDINSHFNWNPTKFQFEVSPAGRGSDYYTTDKNRFQAGNIAAYWQGNNVKFRYGH